MTNSIAIVAGSFHKEMVEQMVEEAKIAASDNDMILEEICWVPGSMEVPLQLKRLLLRESIDGAIVLGIIEKGETDHGLVIGQAVMKTLVELQLIHDKPIGVGIIGPGAEVHHLGPRIEPHARNAVQALLTFFDGE